MERQIDPATTANASPPIGSLGKELVRIHSRPQLVAIAVAFVVALPGPYLVLRLVEGGAAGSGGAVAWIWLGAAVATGSMLLGCVVTSFLPPLLLRGADRQASAVHAWLGAREIRRLYGSTSGAFKIPTTVEKAEKWLASNPDLPLMRPLRFELLLMTRRWDEAHALIDLFPRSTPLEAFRIAEAEALVADQTTGQADVAALRDAAARVPDPVDRAEATASVAVLEARRLIGRTDWRKPFAAARPLISESDFTILTRDMGAPIFRRLWPFFVLPVAALSVAIALFITANALS